MAKTDALLEQTDTGHIQVLQAYNGDVLNVPGDSWLLKADFTPQGSDLLLIGPDGSQILIRDYFNLDIPPDLVSSAGGVISAELAIKLAGPAAPGQFALLENGPFAELAQAAESIGRVEATDGLVEAIRIDGTKVSLAKGDDIFQGDTLVTAQGAAIGITFVDDTTFSLGEEGRMVIDEMVYDPETQEGAFSANLVQGVFSFVSGEIAKTSSDAMTITTPVATIGIRGTKVAGRAAQEGAENTITLLPETNAQGEQIVGELSVTNQGGTVTLGSVGATVQMTSAFQAPPPPVTFSPQQIQQNFGSSLSTLSTTAAAKANNDAAENAQQAEVAQAQAEQAGAEADLAAAEAEAAQAEAQAAQAEADAAGDPEAIAAAEAAQAEADTKAAQAEAKAAQAEAAQAEAEAKTVQAEQAQAEAEHANNEMQIQAQAFATFGGPVPASLPNADAPPEGAGPTQGDGSQPAPDNSATGTQSPLVGGSGQFSEGSDPLLGGGIPVLGGAVPLIGGAGEDSFGGLFFDTQAGGDAFTTFDYTSNPIDFGAENVIYPTNDDNADTLRTTAPDPVISSNNVPVISGIKDTSAHNTALQMDGANDYVSTGITTLTSDFTIEAWFMYDTQGAYLSIASKHTISGQSNYLTEFDLQIQNNGNLNFFMGNGSNYGILLDGGVQTVGTWHHVAVSANSGAMEMYLDGNSVATGTFSGSRVSGAQDIEIGHYNNGGNQFFNGMVDEVRLWDNALSATAIKSAYTTTLSNPSSQSGLVGYWNFNTISSGTTPNSASGGTSATLGTGTVGDSAEPQAVTLAGAALKFDGTDDYVDLGSSGNLATGSNSFTWETWVKMGASMNQRVLLNIGTNDNGSSGKSGSLMIDGSGHAKLQIWNASGHPTGSTNVADGNWHHIAMSYDAGSARAVNIYVDGVKETQTLSAASATAHFSGSSATLGARHLGALPLNGELSDVRVWTSVRTLAEVQSDMLGSPTGDTSKLAGHWSLSEGTGAAVADLSGNGHGGTITNQTSGSETWVSTGTVEFTATTVTAMEDTPLSASVVAADADGDSLTYSIGTQASHGIASINAAGVLTYSPTANYNGSDSVSVSASDGNGGVATQAISLNVTAVNDEFVYTSTSLGTGDLATGGGVATNGSAGDTINFATQVDNILKIGGTVLSSVNANTNLAASLSNGGGTENSIALVNVGGNIQIQIDSDGDSVSDFTIDIADTVTQASYDFTTDIITLA